MKPEPHPDDRRLEEIASAILDGRDVDWQAVASEQRIDMVDELRALAAVVRAHQRPAATKDGVRSDEDLGAWGHLRLLERIGEGAFGEVFRAWDTRLDREVALKLLCEHEGEAPRAVTPIIEEARLLARVRHPNVVTVYGAERIGGRIGIWTEFVRGETVTALVERAGPLPPERVIDIGIALCHALSAVHAAGVVHGDVKAQNVMVESHGRVVLLDLGTGREPLPSDTRAREVSGTPLYMAPELWRAAPPSPSSDIYSVGVLLYYALSGRYPIRAATAKEVQAAHAAGEAVPLRVAGPGTPAQLLRIIDQALQPDPACRFEDAAALGGALARTRHRWFQPRHVLMAGTALVLVVLMGAGISVLLRRDSVNRGRPSRAALAPEQLTSAEAEGQITAVAISRDGARLLYAHLGGIFLQQIPDGSPRRVNWNGPPAVSDLAWLPGTSECLVAAGGTLWRLDLSSGAQQKVLESVSKVSVSPDGKRVAIQRENVGLFVATVEGSDAVQVATPPDQHTVFGKAVWAPDGRRLAYVRYQFGLSGRGSDIETVRPDGTDRTVVWKGANVRQLAWAGNHILFPRALQPPDARYSRLWRIVVSMDGQPSGEPEPLTDLPQFNFNHPSLTDDGTRLVFGRNRFLFEVHVAEFQSGDGQVSNLRRAVDTTVEIQPVAWTPGGEILFKRLASPGAVFRQRIGGARAQEFLTFAGRSVLGMAFAAEGAWALSLVSSENALAQVIRSPADGGRSEVLFEVPASESSIRCARGSAALCAVVHPEGGGTRIITFDPSVGYPHPLPLLPAAASQESWDLSPDGRLVAMVPATGIPRVSRIELAGNEVREFPTGGSRPFSLTWLPDSDGWMLASLRGEQGAELVRQTESSRVLEWKSELSRLHRPIVSPDGRHIMVGYFQTESTVWMLKLF